MSGFFGPVERMARAAGGRVSFLPADFHGLERLARRLQPRVVLAVTTPPDADGWLSFGTHSGASYRAFLEAARDPARLAIAELNSKMPRVEGIADLGGNRIHMSEVDVWVEHDADLVVLPEEHPRRTISPSRQRLRAHRSCGRSFLCLKSTARVGSQRVSTIVPAFAPGTRVTTARHHVQHVVTEQGVADLSVLADTERPATLLRLAHPDFRDDLEKAWREGLHRA